MNNNYKMPRLIFAGLFFFGFVSAAHSQTLDPGTMDRLRTALGQVRHPDQVDMLQMAQSIAPVNTDAYLIALASQPTSVPGLRLLMLPAGLQAATSTAKRIPKPNSFFIVDAPLFS